MRANCLQRCKRENVLPFQDLDEFGGVVMSGLRLLVKVFRLNGNLASDPDVVFRNKRVDEAGCSMRASVAAPRLRRSTVR